MDASFARPIRAILVFDTLELGGAERQGLHLARYLKQSGAHVEIRGLTGPAGRLSRLCDEAGIPWRAVGIAWRGELTRAPSNFLALRGLARDLRAVRPDVLLPYTYFSNVICGLVWRFSGATLCVWNQRDAGMYLDVFDPWRAVASRLTPWFIANSEHGRQALIRTVARAEQVEVIANGVELGSPVADRDAWRRNLGVSSAAFVVCMLSNVHANKDHTTLLHAWRQFVDGIPRDAEVRLVLAGRIEETGEATKQLVTSLGLTETVSFLGPVDDVPGLLAAVDASIHSSRSEGLPNAVLEAMMAGLPVVASDLPGIREAVGAAGSGFLAPVGDAAAMADHIGRLFREPALRVSVGTALAQRAREQFDVTRMCRTTVSYLASRSRAPS